MAKTKTTILLFTQWFPYNQAQERSFLEDELPYLKKNFDEVILVPKIVEGELYELPAGILVDTSLAERVAQISRRVKWKVILSPLFIKEVLFHARNRVKFRFALAKGLAAYSAKNWLKEKYEHSPNHLVLYSFWMDSLAVGALLFREKFRPQTQVITRCHNFDIYGNEENCFYVPYFQYAYPRFDAVFPDSDKGSAYLKTKIPTIQLRDGIMGVRDPKHLNEGSTDGIFRIVSCAYLVPRKRVDLFGYSLLKFAERYPDLRVEWYHIGEGPMMETISVIAEKLTAVGYPVHLLGNLSRNHLLEFYKSTPVDLFVNSSSFEGTPVSLMEAISCSIPLLVSDCGGNLIMATKGAGWAFSVDADEGEVSNALYEVVKQLTGDESTRRERKDAARKVWEKHYNSDHNYERFCEEIKALCV